MTPTRNGENICLRNIDTSGTTSSPEKHIDLMAGIVGSSLSEVLTGNYQVKIESYSKLKNGVVGTEIKTTFSLLNRQWTLKCYLDGDKEESKEFISVFLYNDQQDSEVTASFVFVLVDQQFNSLSLSTIRRPVSKQTQTFAKKGLTNCGWGFTKFANKNLLSAANSPYIVNDSVIFRVEISIITNNESKLNRRTSAVKQLGANDVLENLFLSGLGSDVSIVISGSQIPSHKCILMARSPVLKAMFTHNMSESNTNEIVISDFSPEVVREMLHFMYTDKLQSETLDNTVYEGLLGAAIKYDVSALEAHCVDHFVGLITDETILEINNIAEKCGCEELRAACLSHIKMNAASLMHTDSFVEFLQLALSSYHLLSDCA